MKRVKKNAPAANGRTTANDSQSSNTQPSESQAQAIQWLSWQEANALDVHPTAKKLPPLLKEEYEALKDSIAHGGVSAPVLINRRKDTLLDGYHRRKACVELKADLPAIVYQGPNEKQVIVDRALAQRQLTDDQRLAFVIDADLDELRAKAQKRIVAARQKIALLKSAKPSLEADKIALRKPAKPLHTHAEIAKKAGVAESKARGAIEKTEHDPDVLKDVLEGKKRWRDVEKPEPKRKPKKVRVSFGDAVWKRYTLWINGKGMFNLVKQWQRTNTDAEQVIRNTLCEQKENIAS
jgi:ParB-like nuclease domain